MCLCLDFVLHLQLQLPRTYISLNKCLCSNYTCAMHLLDTFALMLCFSLPEIKFCFDRLSICSGVTGFQIMTSSAFLAREHFPSHLSASTFRCTVCHVTLVSAAGTWDTRGLGCKARALLVLWYRALWWEMTLNLFPIMLPGQSRMINVPLPSDPWRVFHPVWLGPLG